MQTRILKVDALQPDSSAITEAAGVIQSGRLVAFPTETVYGLGANALDLNAVSAIYAAKDRPAVNPIIVHVAGEEEAQQLAAVWPPAARRLAQRFWPGPLTLVVARGSLIPDIVTAGGPTVGLRCPAHPVALALIRAAGVPIAAPSANLSTQLSPTTAEHVRQGLEGRIPLILDAGGTPVGIESTVLDVTVNPPALLRPGGIGLDELEAEIGTVARPQPDAAKSQAVRSPGQMARHYAPRTPLEVSSAPLARALELIRKGKTVARLRIGEPLPTGAGESGPEIWLPAEPRQAAAGLYAALHALDAAGADIILVDQAPPGDAWLAISDRVARAAHSKLP